MRPALRIAASLIALLFLGTFIQPSRSAPAARLRLALVRFEPVPLDVRAPRRIRLGSLRFLGGWHLVSDNPWFGGISAIHVEDDRMIALGDAGLLIRVPLRLSDGTATATIDALPDGPGSASVKSDRDTESLAIAGDRAWIGFERRNAVWRYRLPGWRSDSHAAPGAMRRWPNNAGPEGLVRLADGRFLVFSEAAPNGGGANQAILFQGDPAEPGTPALRLAYRPPSGYSLTDAALLPDGRLLLLNRRFTILEGISAKLVVAAFPDAVAGAVIEGEEIADLRAPVSVDNMEALSVTRGQGRTIVWLASDDNYNPLQRTLLLKFALAPPR